MKFDIYCAENVHDFPFKKTVLALTETAAALKFKVGPGKNSTNGWAIGGTAFQYWSGCYIVKNVCVDEYLNVNYFRAGLIERRHDIVQFVIMTPTP